MNGTNWKVKSCVERGQVEQEKVRLQWEWNRLESEKMMVQREKDKYLDFNKRGKEWMRKEG